HAGPSLFPYTTLFRSRWVAVAHPEMDCGIAVDLDQATARTVALADVRSGELMVVGHEGVRVVPLERPRRQPQVFAFMGSSVSSRSEEHTSELQSQSNL